MSPQFPDTSTMSLTQLVRVSWAALHQLPKLSGDVECRTAQTLISWNNFLASLRPEHNSNEAALSFTVL
jgi:hypothetical protein